MLPPCRSRRAFTLIELLVSMAVLTLLIVTVVGLLNAVSGSTASSRRRMDADKEARRVLDRMGSDLARMFKRADADSLFASVNGPDSAHGANDKMYFYSEAPAYFDPSTQAAGASMDPRATAGLIGYRINKGASATAPRWQLERLGKALTWDGRATSPAPGAVVFLTYPAAAPAPAPTPTPDPASTLAGNWGGGSSTTIGTAPGYDDGTDKDYQVLSRDVFRLEYCFVLKAATAAKPYSLVHDQKQGFKDVSAIMVAIAILDQSSRARIPGTVPGTTPDMTNLVAALPDPDFIGAPAKSMAEIWNDRIKDGTFATSAGIPASVATQVRIYQRSFPLNTPD